MNQNVPLNLQVYLKLILLSIINDQRNLKIATLVKLINKSLKQFRLLKQTIEKMWKASNLLGPAEITIMLLLLII